MLLLEKKITNSALSLSLSYSVSFRGKTLWCRVHRNHTKWTTRVKNFGSTAICWASAVSLVNLPRLGNTLGKPSLEWETRALCRSPSTTSCMLLKLGQFCTRRQMLERSGFACQRPLPRKSFQTQLRQKVYPIFASNPNPGDSHPNLVFCSLQRLIALNLSIF